MEKYKEIVIKAPTSEHELLIALLAGEGFDSFWEQEKELMAYIPCDLWNENRFAELLAAQPTKYAFEVRDMAEKNWNAEWESNFDPVEIPPYCRIRAAFHASQCDDYQLEVLIAPKMAFGTGHHETTRMMVENLFAVSIKDKTVLDAGTGTGVLAIVAEKRGATLVDAYDIDEWSFENTKENCKLNDCRNVEVSIGTIHTAICRSSAYDIILANINRNVLLEEMSAYSARLKKGGILFLSGFYTEDIAVLNTEAQKHGLTKKEEKTLNNWVSLVMIKL